MAPKNSFKKLFSTVSGKTIIMAVALVATVSFLLVSIGFSKVVDIDNKSIKRIETFLSTVKTVGNFVISNEKIRSIFNVSLSTAQKGADISYGLLVLSAINEFDLIDMVTSQQYKQKARDYFNEVMNERMNIIEDARKTGYDFSKVAFSKVMAGSPMSVPMGALVWETISIIDKSIAIFTTLNVVRQEMFYDGIWRYFDSRRWGESHNVAWEDAKAEMGIAVVKTSIRLGKKMVNEDSNQLALQFATFWQKWGPYTNSAGITSEAREKFKQEMFALVKEGSEKYALANEKPQIFLFAKAKSFFNTVAEEIARISDILKGLANQFSFKAATGSLINTLFPQQPLVQNQSLGSSGTSDLTITEPNLNQEQIDDLNEQADFLKGQKSAASKPLISPLISPTFSVSPSPSVSPSFSPSPSVSPSPSASPSPTPSLTPTPTPSPSPSVAKCEKSQGTLPAMNRVIINEIAWMGTTNSASDEWIELKNISGTEIDLTGWQLLDKNQDIKIIFPKGAKLLSNGFFLLERTNDQTVLTKTADLIYTGSLANADEALYLFNGNCQLQDEVLTSSNWPAGNNSSKRTMERKGSFGWQTSASINGTPKSENSSGYVEIVSNSFSSPSSPSTPSPPPKILITEIQIEGNKDFIELYNPSEQTANLSGYQLKKKTKTGSEYSIRLFPDGTTLLAKSYLLWATSQDNYYQTVDANLFSSAYLSQDNSLVLFDKDKNIVDAAAWGENHVNPFKENIPFSQNPRINQTIGRKWVESQSYQDTDNNLNDFEIQFSTPKTENKTFSDIVPPETSIDNNPFSLINLSEMVFIFSSNEENSTFECKLDEGNWQVCFSPQQYSNLSDGFHTFYVRAKDINQNADFSPAQYQWQIDSVSPQTEILTHPSSLTNQNQANFVFSSSEENPTFECKLDQGSWETCETPKLFNNLLDGEHTFYVRARDAAQNLDSSPAQNLWTIDTLIESPALSLTDLDSDSLFYTNEKRVKVTISNDQEAVNWLLSQSETAVEDPNSLWQSEKPLEFILLEGDGPKTVYLWIKDESGNVSSGISAQIILDITFPSVQFSSLAQTQLLTDFDISWSGKDAVSGILEYHLKFREQSEVEPNSWQTILGQSYQFSGLNGKIYYFKIRAKDNAGNLSEWSSEISTTIEQPILEVSPMSLSFEAIEFGQNPANKNLTIENIGFGDLNWEIVLPEVDEWLSVNLISGQAPASVSVLINTFGLEADLFQTTIKVSSNTGSKEIGVVLNLGEDVIPPQAPIITSHSQDQVLNSSLITLAGQTEANALILISLNSQNAEVMADENGHWQKEIELAEGQNKIEVRAKDEAGNEGQPTILNLLLDVQPPTVIINELPEYEPSLSFAISWSGNDILSGIDGFKFRYFENDNGSWTYWPSENEYTTAVQYDFTGEDNKIYYFQIKARDKAGNESNWQETSTQIKMPFAQLSVVINEIAWMGTKTKSNDEWIELFNNTTSDIDLVGWTLTWTHGTTINFHTFSTSTGNTKIPTQGFLLLERSDDKPTDISGDQFFKGDLYNDGEELKLYDVNGNLIDEVDCEKDESGKCKKWFWGVNEKNKETKEWIRVSMERIKSNEAGGNSENWANNNLITRNG
ncbi:lamin tail domain-containing protein, partial [Patescibacteria group bacterium]|nr:lamin tail domain-containing protein [Patescibacteria group bacterium]